MKFLAVCGFGVGSSMVLKMTLERVARELGIEADVENTDLSSAKGTTCDAIFTSHELLGELESSVNCPIYPIKKYMDTNEVKGALQSFLETKA